MEFARRYWIKVRHLLPAFVLVAILSTVCFAAFRYVFDIRYHLLHTNIENWEMWLPIALAVVAAMTWFRPRTMILAEYENKRRDPRFAFQAICGGTAAGMMILSQMYLSTASGRLITLATADDMTKQAPERYYQLKYYEVYTEAPSTYLVYGRSGRYNDHFDMDYYAVLALLSDSSQPIGPDHRYWYAFKFHQSTTGVRSSEEEAEMKEFSAKCKARLAPYDYRIQPYFERVQPSRDGKYFQKAIANILKHPVDDSYVILKPHTEPFDQRNGHKFEWIFGVFGIGLLVFLIALLFPTLDREEYERQQSGLPASPDDLDDLLKYFIPRGDHFITAILLDINILVYLAMILSGLDVVSPGSDELLRWGGDRRAEVLHGEWWRLVTSMFVHGGIMHLVMNLIALMIAAACIEPVLGRRNYLMLYLLSGVCGSLCSIWWHADTVSIGASGAIMGLFGGIIGLSLIDAFPKKDKWTILGVIGIYVIINLIWGMAGGIDNAAHIGGLLSGAILAVILFKTGTGGPLREALAKEADGEEA